MTFKHILSPEFKYIPAHETDIAKRFDKIAPGWNKRPTEKKIEKRNVVKLRRSLDER